MRAAAAALAVFVSPLLSATAWSAQVTALTALHHDGQTFLTWTCPPGAGWSYRVYRSYSPIQSTTDLATAPVLGVASDSSWCDRRLESFCGTAYGYAVDSLAAPLDSTQGLFVWTPDTTGPAWYAVTCVAADGNEDRSITPGENSLAAPVSEHPEPPRPVYQRTLIGPGGAPADVYTLWTGPNETPFFPAMCNRPSEPYDCSINRGATGGALMFHAHVRGGTFYLAGWGAAGEWQLAMDDFIRTPDVNTFWFGYHQSYDIESLAIPSPPTGGTVYDYTARRVEYTLEWARRNLPVDTSRVYVMGNSMGGTAGVFLAMWRPDLIAATMVNIPLFDFSFTSDAHSDFREGGLQRATCDRLWGTVSTGLHMEDGTPVYERLNAGAMARSLEARWVPPIIAFSGRNDSVLGWSEKIPFYRAMRESRAGGTFFWDTRSHENTATAGAWWPMQNYAYVHRFRTNLSFPALTNCSADGDPGNGNAADGDSIGTINGFLEWDDAIMDEPDRWRLKLTLRNLTTLWGSVVKAPESLTVDVTPRRLQRFRADPNQDQPWRVVRLGDGAVVQSGTAPADSNGVVTIPGVKVFRSGSVLELGLPPITAVGGAPAPPARGLPDIGPLPCPLRGTCALAIDWPGAGDATVDILDAAGRRVRTLLQGHVEGGRQECQLEASGLGSGIYFVRARERSATAVLRFVVIR